MGQLRRRSGLIRLVVIGAATATVAVACMPAANPSASWGSFRGGPRNRGWNRAENLIGPTTVMQLRPVWARDTGQPDDDAPVVAGGRVFTFCSAGLCAVDVASGRLLWSTPAARLSRAPAVTGGTIYFARSDRPGSLAAADAATGEIRWTRQLSGGLYGAPTIANGLVYAGTNGGYLVALRTSDGTRVWRFRTSGPEYANVAVDGGTLFSQVGQGLMALNAATGRLRWSGVVGPGEALLSAAVADGKALVGTNEGHVGAFDTACQSRPQCEPVWSTALDQRGPVGLAVANGVVFAAAGSGYLYALDLATGRQLWASRQMAQFGGYPSVANGVAYVTTKDGSVHGFPASGCGAATCEPIWSTQLRPVHGAYMASSVAVADGSLYVRAGSWLYRLTLPSMATPASLPAAPTDVHAGSRSGQVAVSWSAPRDTGRLPVLAYRIEWAGGSMEVSGPFTEGSIDGLPVGQKFTFRVSTRTAAGLSPPSEPTGAVLVSAA